MASSFCRFGWLVKDHHQCYRQLINVKASGFNICKKLSTFSKPLYYVKKDSAKLVCKKVTNMRQCNLSQHIRTFHTSGRKEFIPPVFWVFIKPAAKIATMISGRSLRKYYQALSPEKQVKFRKKYKQFIGMSIVTLCAALIANYNYHLKETPITHRKRYIAFTNDQIMKLVTEEAKSLLENLKPHVLPSTNPAYGYVMNIVAKIMLANEKDLDFFKEQNWTIVIVESPDANAFVLPTGHIFVFTGLFKVAKNEDQVAVILGHEMAHALLQHGAEKIAIAQLIDYMIIFVMAAIWAIMPNDGIALVTQWFYHKVVDLLISLPYSRKLENEADEVGLELIAKACYDVRESSNLWSTMYVQGKLDEIKTDGMSLPEFLSTHPSNDKRAIRLDNIIPKAIDIRDSCKCKPLPYKDPRIEGIMLLDMFSQYLETHQKEIEQRKQEKNETIKHKEIKPKLEKQSVAPEIRDLKTTIQRVSQQS